jgi:hypothetical protein
VVQQISAAALGKLAVNRCYWRPLVVQLLGPDSVAEVRQNAGATLYELDKTAKIAASIHAAGATFE